MRLLLIGAPGAGKGTQAEKLSRHFGIAHISSGDLLRQHVKDQTTSGQTIKQSGTSWEVIQPDGTQYWFGVNQLPGFAAGDQATNSLWTVPVWEGCGTAAFCSQPWRYNLDYVMDPHGNAIAYFYSPQTNSYSEQNGATANGTYTQGGTLTKIEYGLRAGNVYTHTPAAQVNFTTGTTVRQDAPTFWTSFQLTGR